jgi:hypothetical protein
VAAEDPAPQLRPKKGLLGMYVPPLMQALGLAEVEHNLRNNRMPALGSSPPVRSAAWQ